VTGLARMVTSAWLPSITTIRSILLRVRGSRAVDGSAAGPGLIRDFMLRSVADSLERGSPLGTTRARILIGSEPINIAGLRPALGGG
jgi:hypothetical protein